MCFVACTNPSAAAVIFSLCHFLSSLRHQSVNHFSYCYRATDMVTSELCLIWHPLTPYKPFHYSRRVRAELNYMVISGTLQLKSQHKRSTNFLPRAEIFLLLLCKYTAYRCPVKCKTDWKWVNCSATSLWSPLCSLYYNLFTLWMEPQWTHRIRGISI